MIFFNYFLLPLYTRILRVLIHINRFCVRIHHEYYTVRDEFLEVHINE